MCKREPLGAPKCPQPFGSQPLNVLLFVGAAYVLLLLISKSIVVIEPNIIQLLFFIFYNFNLFVRHGYNHKFVNAGNVCPFPSIIVSSQTEIVFDGASLVFDKDANLCGALPMFESAMQVFECNEDGSINAPILEPAASVPSKELNPATLVPALNIDQVYKALVLGVKDYFNKMGFKKAILGSSGGIDSAVTLAIACEALGKENVYAILMPSTYSTGHSVDDAVELSKNLGNPYDTLPIKEVYESFLQTLKPIFKEMPFCGFYD